MNQSSDLAVIIRRIRPNGEFDAVLSTTEPGVVRATIDAFDAAFGRQGGAEMAKSGGIIPLLASTTITTAVTGVAQTAVSDGSYPELQAPTSISLLAIFTYGSGGTTAKAWVQTSMDNGTTWFDIANFAFTTASATKLSSITANIAPATQGATPTDGSLADNTINQGVLGNRYRVKLTTTGTYAGGTTLAINLFARR